MSASTSNYEMLLQCYLSEQMSERQLQHHMDEDEVFKVWFARKMAERRARGGR